jgi:hypothetical protein
VSEGDLCLTFTASVFVSSSKAECLVKNFKDDSIMLSRILCLQSLYDAQHDPEKQRIQAIVFLITEICFP